MATERPGTARLREYRDRLTGLIQFLRSLPPEQQNPVQIAVVEMMLDKDNQLIDASENNKPLVCTWYGNCIEILSGMDIAFYNPVIDLMFHLGLTDYADAKECDKYNLDEKICSLVRYAVYSMENKLHPRPDCFIAMQEPCDGQLMLHQAFSQLDHLKGVPSFQIDPSYGHTDKDFEYVAKQLKDMIKFLEEKTGAKYEFEKVAKVVEETNKQYAIWAECNELMKASPAPLPSFAIPDAFWPLMQHLKCGNPVYTKIMETVRDVAKANVEKGVGPVMNEQIRLFWPDLDPLWSDKLGQWLAEEWNAVVVQTFQGLTPYTPVDTSNEDAMLFGLARRAVAEVPMIRQGRGWVDVVVDDVTNAIQDYNIDAVLFSGHMGHKDQSGINHFMKKACRDMKVPLLTLTTSLFDERYTPMEKVKSDISNFFSANGWKRNKKA
jgi:benzoyl-CoA reductase/2-hydroxyglutaryl-CoA dehydratase subunit BcrC/BadD/HgdB